MKIFFKHIAVEYSDLKNTLNISDGSLAAHLKSLINGKLIKKQVILDENENREIFYGISEYGRQQWNDFKFILKEITKDDKLKEVK